jgi:hypothetical protein
MRSLNSLRRVETDDSEERFNEKLDKIAEQKPGALKPKERDRGKSAK